MLGSVRLIFLGAVALGVPLGWYDGEDGAFQDPQGGKLDRTIPMLSITIDPDSTKYPAYPLKLKVTFYNDTDHTAYFFQRGIMAVDFDFEVKNLGGAVLQPANLFRVLRANAQVVTNPGRLLQMKPGDSCVNVINLLKLYDLKPGQTYTIQVWKGASSRLDHAPTEKAGIPSNILRFTVPK
jgi:hypothetical protein